MTPPRYDAAFLDVDRTVVTANTGTLYMRWRYERGEAGIRDMLRVGGWLLRYTFGVLDAETLARSGVRDVEGVPVEHFRQEIKQWYYERVRHRVSKHARQEVARIRDQCTHLVLLSAGTEFAVQCVADDLQVPHTLSTKLESRAGVLTGRCETLCYGDHKVTMAEQWADEHNVDLDRSLFYTDSVSDLPMLERVGYPRVINPDPRLRFHAMRRRWPIDQWR